MKIKDVRLQNADCRHGLTENPVIAWTFEQESAGRKQISCRILLSHNGKCIYDTGEKMTNRQNGHMLPIKLETHQKYSICVRVLDDSGEVTVSQFCTFISGISEAEGWKAKWISNRTSRPQELGGLISCKKEIRFAAASVTGVGQYVFTVNGALPDRTVLNGSWTDFHKRIHYRTFELTDFLHTGRNELRLKLGNGWYLEEGTSGRYFYTLHSGYEPYGDCLAGILQLTVEYADGTVETFGTDESWWGASGKTLYTNSYGAEDYDARVEEEKSPVTVLSQEDCPKGRLMPALYPPVEIKKVYEGILKKELPNGGLLYDFGQNISGLFEIRVSGQRGVKLRMQPLEKLDINGNPWPTVDSWCSYICRGGQEESWHPCFTYQAGRYLLVTLDKDSEVREMPKILGVRGYFTTSSAKDTGSFFCSDPRYMQIHDLVVRAIESNLHHIHTDCPTIERLGWQEQNHLMAPSVFYVKGADTLWDKILQDLEDAQYAEEEYDVDTGAFPHTYSEGLLPSIAPRYARFLQDGGEGSFWDIPCWGSSILMAAYEQYRFSGRTEALTMHYEAARRYVDYLYQKYENYSMIYQKPGNMKFLCHGLGDWGIRQNRGESRENIETAYLYKDLELLSLSAGFLGRDGEAQLYAGLARKVKDAYNDSLLVWNPFTGEWCYRSFDKTGIEVTQATQAIPLQFGMVPEEKKESVIKSFLQSCATEQFLCGEIGMPYVLRTLGELKQADLVHRMMMQHRQPGYYRFIELGETTMPEFWRDDARSRNHDMMGSILEWFYRYLCGISSEDGFRTIRIAPILPKGVDYIRCCYKAITGMVEVQVETVGEYQRIRASIPVNTGGVLCFGKHTATLHGGQTYIYEVMRDDLSVSV